MPIFKRGLPASESGFVDAVPGAHVIENEMTAVQVRGRKVILTRYEGVVYAIDSACPHAAADLSKGLLHRWRVCCHEHDYCFDIRNGRIVWPDDETYRLRRYEAIEEGDMVKIKFS